MLVLYETPAGFALFKMLDDGKLKKPDDLYKSFASPDVANETVKLKAFQKFENTVEALSGMTAIVEGKLSKELKEFLSKEISEKEMKKEMLAVADAKLGGAIAKKLGIKVSSDSTVMELYRGIRSQIESLLSGFPASDMNAMVLGLSHSLSRYKLKFSPDKVDTMIVQAIALLDDLDKELNTYAMRVKEWYGWHFPEMGKIVVDNLAYAKVVKTMGVRTKAQETDLSDILPEEIEKEVKDAAEISMGTEISEEDIENIIHLCDQVISITEYRTQLYEYLKNRMNAIAPNLTTIVGELVGARLISHAGSLINLAKYPASTVQILGAEKALFRALKTKHDTPKYGLIFHASLVGQAAAKSKGKIARMVAAKSSIAARVDALAETENPSVGVQARAAIDARLRQLEGIQLNAKGAKNMRPQQQKKFEPKPSASYNAATDFMVSRDVDEAPVVVKAGEDKKAKKEKKDKKRPRDEDEDEETVAAKEDKKDKKKKKKKEDDESTSAESSKKEKKKAKKAKSE